MIKPPDVLECYLHDISVMDDAAIEDKYYTSGIALPRYPMPAIRTGTLILNWKGEHRMCVVYANEWGGYATLISDEYAK